MGLTLRTTGMLLLVGAAAAPAVSCSSGTDDLHETPVGSGGSGASGSGGTSTGGSVGVPSGGSGGGLFDGGATGGSGGGGEFDASCATFTAEAHQKLMPSDIIIAVDQSGSMDKETQWVQEQLNGFSRQIINANIDVHVILIAEKPGGPVGENSICVPPPLAGGSCGSNPPVFTQVNSHVDSVDALLQITGTYGLYEHALRPEAHKHIIVISDDNSALPGFMFNSTITGKPKIDDYTFHAIVCPQMCSSAASIGQVYMNLVFQTGGVLGNLCNQDFAPVWNEVSKQVIDQTKLGCAWEIPAPPQGETLNPDKVNVVYTSLGVENQLGRVASSSDCGQSSDSWYYDNPAAPTTVIACPGLCNEINKAQEAQIDIVFGCDSIIHGPK